MYNENYNEIIHKMTTTYKLVADPVVATEAATKTKFVGTFGSFVSFKTFNDKNKERVAHSLKPVDIKKKRSSAPFKIPICKRLKHILLPKCVQDNVTVAPCVVTSWALTVVKANDVDK